MKQKSPLSFLVVFSSLLCAIPSCTDKEISQGEFIVQLGDHRIAGGKGTLRVYKDQGGINYRFSRGGTSFGPTSSPIRQGAKWFAFVETPNRVWIHDGDAGLALLEFDGKRCISSSISAAGGRLAKQIPPDVRARLPESVILPH